MYDNGLDSTLGKKRKVKEEDDSSDEEEASKPAKKKKIKKEADSNEEEKTPKKKKKSKKEPEEEEEEGLYMKFYHYRVGIRALEKLLKKLTENLKILCKKVPYSKFLVNQIGSMRLSVIRTNSIF